MIAKSVVLALVLLVAPFQVFATVELCHTPVEAVETTNDSFDVWAFRCLDLDGNLIWLQESDFDRNSLYHPAGGSRYGGSGGYDSHGWDGGFGGVGGGITGPNGGD